MKYFPWVVIFLISMWVLSVPVIFLYFGIPDSPGIFGDMFGAVNSLFSVLALSGAIYAILLQSRELSAQLEELALQRKEMKLQREEMESSRKELANQNALISEQLAMMQKTFDLQLKKDKESAEPHFYWSNGGASAAHINFIFQNHGGPIRDVKVTTDPPIEQALMTPNNMIPIGEEGTLSLLHRSSPFPPKLVLTIRYTDKLGDSGEQRYEVIHQDAKINPV